MVEKCSKQPYQLIALIALIAGHHFLRVPTIILRSHQPSPIACSVLRYACIYICMCISFTDFLGLSNNPANPEYYSCDNSISFLWKIYVLSRDIFTFTHNDDNPAWPLYLICVVSTHTHIHPYNNPYNNHTHTQVCGESCFRWAQDLYNTLCLGGIVITPEKKAGKKANENNENQNSNFLNISLPPTMDPKEKRKLKQSQEQDEAKKSLIIKQIWCLLLHCRNYFKIILNYLNEKNENQNDNGGKMAFEIESDPAFFYLAALCECMLIGQASVSLVIYIYIYHQSQRAAMKAIRVIFGGCLRLYSDNYFSQIYIYI